MEFGKIIWLLINGIEFWENGTQRYQGKFKNEKYYGESSIYYDNGILYYEGHLLNGYKHGFGKLYDID